MSEATIIREFLVSLGFQLDQNSERRFSDSLAAATLKAVQLGTAVQAAAATVTASVAKIADNLEQLYFASQRQKASAENIRAFQFAIKQMGGDSDQALASLENMARFMRNSPGAEDFLKKIGIGTRDASGQMRDSVEMMADLGKKFAEMPFYKANAFAQVLGIDEKTLMTMREGVGQFSDEYRSMLRAANFDLQTATKGSHDFMNELRMLWAAIGIATQKSGSLIMGPLGDSIHRFRQLVVDNFDHITGVVVKVVGWVFKVADAIGSMVMRGVQAIGYLVDWFDKLPEGSQNIIKWLGLILAAWKALSAGFLSTPLGRVMALISALVLLWDDYQIWKEGGQSLIDWSKWAPGVEKAIGGIKAIGGWIHDALEFTGDWRAALEILLAYVAGKWLTGMLGAFGKAAAAQTAAAAGGVAGIAGKAGMVGLAGLAGWGIGTWINGKLSDGTRDKIGGGIASLLGILGVKEAQEAVEARAKMSAGTSTPANRPNGSVVLPVRPETHPWGKERGLRNNNPGNIEYGTFARRQGAAGVEDQGRFAVFKTAQDGINALAALIYNYMQRGIDSVRTIISRYAPASDKNNTDAYIATVAKKLGVDPNQKLDPKNMEHMTGIVDAIIRVENGKNPYSREMISKAAESAGGRTMGISQTNNITISGVDNPKVAAAEVGKVTNDANERMVRNMRGAVLQ